MKGIKVKKTDTFEFEEKEHSKKGIISCFFCAFECILLGVSIINSYNNKGNGGILLVIIGVSIVLMALIGAYLSYMGMKEKGKIKKQTAWYSLLLHVIILLGMSTIFIAGVMALV